VIFLTAKLQANDLEQFAQLGVAGFIVKPFEPLKIVAQIADQIAQLFGW